MSEPSAKMTAFTLFELPVISTVKPPARGAQPDLSEAKLPTYCLPDSELGMGASYGNSGVWINTKNTGAIERLFCLAHGESAIGSITTRYGISGTPLGALKELSDSGVEYISLRPDGPVRHFELHPAYQRVTFTIVKSVEVRETTFVPLQADLEIDDVPVAYQVIELHNCHHKTQDVRVLAFARLRGSLPEDVVVKYVPELNALAAYNAGSPKTTRFFGTDRPPTGFGTTFEFDIAYDPGRTPALAGDLSAQGDVLGMLQIDVHLRPGESQSFSLIAGAYAEDLAGAIERHRNIPESARALEETSRHLQSVLSRGALLTPDAVLNDGALWSKVNMRRVMGRYPQGAAFTNDPGVMSNVVVRDVAWFIYGNDHFMPEFSRLILDKVAKLQYPSGKLPEYFNAVSGFVEDNGLNINDDTPLFILATNHHYRSSGDDAWLKTIYPAVSKAARYIVTQVDERGLVFCNARDPRGNVWAIAGWRNIIPGYSINGAVTELNSECVAALRAAGHLAQQAGCPEESQEFFAHSASVRDAMDRHLINPHTGLYYLNIDVDGNRHSDVTGDLVFPVMFHACDEETGFRIISRLNSPDFSTPAGLRTASRNDPRYDPAAYAGLFGGVWPGLTWWYSFAAAAYHPDAMVASLRSSFEHYAASPRKNNTVPGQFSEWFDGESLTNKGMRLSPWEPPRFLWAAVEGVCGVTLTAGNPRINPLIPKYWRWVGLRNLPYHGRPLSYFVTRERGVLHIYSTVDVESDCIIELFEEDVSDAVAAFSEIAPVMALRRGDEFVILVGNVSAQTASIPLDLCRLIDRDVRYAVRVYDSEHDAWEECGIKAASDLHSLAVSVEAQGFRLIHLHAQ
ncbi:MAG: hypothetical protein NVS2B17_17820 [Candidatus Velthaea sp.]